jgi:ATP-dependent Clp protease ATP-binding subunit ClpX
MYELPSMRNVGKVVIDETVIEGQTQPYIVYRSDAASAPAIDEAPRRASGSNHH